MQSETIEIASAINPQTQPIDVPSIVQSEQLIARLVQDAGSRADAFRIRHDGYARYGHIDDRPDGIFTDSYDNQGNMLTAVISKNGRPAGTVRVGVRGPGRHDTLPAMEIFEDEIAGTMAMASTDGKVPTAVEVGRIARAPAYEHDATIIHALFRTAGYLILHFDPDIVFSAVRLHHQPIYRRFGFQQVADARQYPGLQCKMVLMAYFKAKFGDAIENLPFLSDVDDEIEQTRRLVAGDPILILPPVTGLHRLPRPGRPGVNRKPETEDCAPYDRRDTGAHLQVPSVTWN